MANQTAGAKHFSSPAVTHTQLPKYSSSNPTDGTDTQPPATPSVGYHAVSSTAMLGSMATNEPHNARSRRYLGRARRKQQRLVEHREGIITERVKLRDQRSEMQRHRDRIAEAEASFMAELGALKLKEEQYLQAETLFGTEEWKFVSREEDLYEYLDELLDYELRDDKSIKSISSESSHSSTQDRFAPHPEPADDAMVEYLSAMAEVDMFKEQIAELRAEQAKQLEEQTLRRRFKFDILPEDQAFLDEFNQLYTDMLGQLVEAELKAQRLKQKVFGSQEFSALERRRASDPWHNAHSDLLSKEHPVTRRSKTESALSNLLNKFSSTRKRIDEWLLASLRDSQLEKARHKSLLAKLGKTDLDDASWWRLVTQYWNTDVPDNPPLNVQMRSPSASHVTAKALGSSQASGESPDNVASTNADQKESRSSFISTVIHVSPQMLPLTTSQPVLSVLDFTGPPEGSVPPVPEEYHHASDSVYRHKTRRFPKVNPALAKRAPNFHAETYANLQTSAPKCSNMLSSSGCQESPKRRPTPSSAHSAEHGGATVIPKFTTGVIHSRRASGGSHSDPGQINIGKREQGMLPLPTSGSKISFANDSRPRLDSHTFQNNSGCFQAMYPFHMPSFSITPTDPLTPPMSESPSLANLPPSRSPSPGDIRAQNQIPQAGVIGGNQPPKETVRFLFRSSVDKKHLRTSSENGTRHKKLPPEGPDYRQDKHSKQPNGERL